MRRPLISTFLIATLGLAPALLDCQILRATRDGEIVDAAFVFKSYGETLDTKRASVEAREFLRANRGKYGLLRLSMSEDEGELISSLASSFFDEQPQDIKLVREHIAKKGLPSRPLMRLIATKDGALLSYRRGAEFTEQILEGTDPTIFVAGNTTHRLLHFDYNAGPLFAPSKDRFSIQLFLIANGPVSNENGRALVRTFQQLTNLDNVNLTIRRDALFISSHFPDLYLFGKTLHLPVIEEYDPMQGITCSSWPRGQNDVSCHAEEVVRGPA